MRSTLAECDFRVHAPHWTINYQLSKCLFTRKLINDSPRHGSDESFCHPPYPMPFCWCFCLPIPRFHSYHTHLRISKENAGNTLDVHQPTLGISFLMMTSNFDSDSFKIFDENSWDQNFHYQSRTQNPIWQEFSSLYDSNTLQTKLTWVLACLASV